MIVWVNGTFGAGKTGACRELTALLPGSVLFDPELVGSGLLAVLPGHRTAGVADVRDLPSWRLLVPEVAAALLAEVPGPLVVPMTLLRQDQRDEVFGALASRRIPVHHVLLHADETVLRARAEASAEARARQPGPLPGGPPSGPAPSCPPSPPRSPAGVAEHLAEYRAALSWLTADAAVVDTTGLTPRATAERIAALVRDGAGRRPIVQTPVPETDTVAAAVLLFDEQDRVLLVDPVYKPGWEFPGGVVERGEAPTLAGVREAAEELGTDLDQRTLRLLVVDWEPHTGPRHGGVRLVYDGGRLDAAGRARLRLPAEELRGWRFVTLEEAGSLLAPGKLLRLAAALRARATGEVLALEAGVPVGEGAAEAVAEG
ncbi:NUDIX hydrolase [Streptacidiphilus sp. ASG 303]|uniref:NUDIX domain-containing protein n=1 Tax=Streptacidiphilus sp. ASG 303 TaxID=2896847 RepID=UPI001E5C7571|nr:NUDIX hydrolase [Streptacidiphilus sp. ASG 303]MCD0483793.1 NUDIX hydrolase [Streptacidiphilus sp. ASG 303]